MEHLTHTTDDTLDRAEEEILSHTVSDDALEAAAGTEKLRGWTGRTFASFCAGGDCC